MTPRALHHKLVGEASLSLAFTRSKVMLDYNLYHRVRNEVGGAADNDTVALWAPLWRKLHEQLRVGA